MKYLWLFLYITTLIAGAWLHTLAPNNFWYIIGFSAGCFSLVFLKLFDITSKRED
jgi:hypothetical protein